VPRDATVNELIRLLKDQLEDMRAERDRWHDAFQASQRLLPPPATSNAAVGNQDSAQGNRWQRAWRWMQKTA
jgi:hypothetical protein